MRADRACQWCLRHQNVLIAVCVIVGAAFGAATPLLGWQWLLGAVAGFTGWVVVCAAGNRAERIQHEREPEVREIRSGMGT